MTNLDNASRIDAAAISTGLAIDALDDDTYGFLASTAETAGFGVEGIDAELIGNFSRMANGRMTVRIPGWLTEAGYGDARIGIGAQSGTIDLLISKDGGPDRRFTACGDLSRSDWKRRQASDLLAMAENPSMNGYLLAMRLLTPSA